MPEEPAFLAGEQERLLTLHGVGPLIGHVERVAAQVAVGGLRRRAKSFVSTTKLFEHALPLVEKTLLEVQERLLVHSFRLLGAGVGRWHRYSLYPGDGHLGRDPVE